MSLPRERRMCVNRDESITTAVVAALLMTRSSNPNNFYPNIRYYNCFYRFEKNNYCSMTYVVRKLRMCVSSHVKVSSIRKSRVVIHRKSIEIWFDDIVFVVGLMPRKDRSNSTISWTTQFLNQHYMTADRASGIAFCFTVLFLLFLLSIRDKDRLARSLQFLWNRRTKDFNLIFWSCLPIWENDHLTISCDGCPRIILTRRCVSASWAR